MPVFPAVPSTMTPPGRSWPRSSASLMIQSAARSLTEPPGLRNSALPRIVHPVSSEARRSFISGVFPTVPTNPSRIFMPPSHTLGRNPRLSGGRPNHQARWLGSGRRPLLAEMVPVAEEPIERDQGVTALDCAGIEHRFHFSERLDHHADVFVLRRQ